MENRSWSVGIAVPSDGAIAGAGSTLEAFEQFFAAMHFNKFDT